MCRINSKSKGGNIIKRLILDKVVPTLLAAAILGIVSSFVQIHDNKASIIKLAEETKAMEVIHVKRLERLETSRENMGNFFVTRAEFNVIVQAQNEKINKIDRNIEKLLDIQMNHGK